MQASDLFKKISGNSHIVQEFTVLLSVNYVEKYKETSLLDILKTPPVKPMVQAGSMLPISEVFQNTAKQHREKEL